MAGVNFSLYPTAQEKLRKNSLNDRICPRHERQVVANGDIKTEMPAILFVACEIHIGNLWLSQSSLPYKSNNSYTHHHWFPSFDFGLSYGPFLMNVSGDENEPSDYTGYKNMVSTTDSHTVIRAIQKWWYKFLISSSFKISAGGLLRAAETENHLFDK